VRRAGQTLTLARARLDRTRAGRRCLAEVPALLGPILARIAAAGHPEAANWVAQRTQLSGTQVAVTVVGPPGGPAAAIVKIPATPDGIASQLREAAALGALEGEAGLGEFRALIPAGLARGQVEGRAFSAEAAMPGVDGRRLMDTVERAAEVSAAAAAAIAGLHRATGSPVTPDAAVLDRWIGERAARLAPAAADRGAVGRLEETLRRWWQGRPLTASWVHGDFWPGNVMFDPATLAVTGIIDWEWAAPGEPPALDLLNLVINARMAGTRRQFGEVVAALARHGDWTPAEVALVSAADPGLVAPGDLGLPRELLLLAWLRHVAFNLIQVPGDARNWVWTSRNVDPVLRLV
jgi:hypothetical protein